jgi:hypothetical protein
MLNAFRCLILLCFLPVALSAQSEIPTREDLSSGERIVEKYPDRVNSLFEAINLDLPVLAAVKSEYDQGNLAPAIDLLIKYYRGKSISPSLAPDLPPARKDILELAEDATRDIFTIQSRTYLQPRLPDGGLDWDNLGPNNDKEWAWMMNRHQHFDYLITAYNHTHKAKYLQTISDHLIDWIPSHSAPNHVTFSTSWRALEAARRIMDSWLAVFFYARAEPAISDEAIFLMLTSIPEHAVSLRKHDSFWGGNHKTTEKMAIVVCALTWSEFREAPGWLKRAVEKIENELFKQTYPDGSYKELANHYQKLVAENYLLLVKILRGSTMVSTSSELGKRVESMWNYLAYVARPSGFGPLNNDSSLEDNFTYLQDANRFFNRSDWTYILSYGQKGTEPEQPPSRYFPWAGHAIMRNGWGTPAHWAFFDIGPNGSAHQHRDKLHLSISIGQYDLLVDSGRYVYKPSPIRTYFRSGAGHNIVRIDGKDPIRSPNTVKSPIPNLVSIQPDYDLFQGKVEFRPDLFAAKSVDQTRTVVYFRDTGWLVIDELTGYGEHRYDTNWNFHPDCVVTRKQSTLVALLPDGSKARLKLLNGEKGSWDFVRGQMNPEIRGWYSWAYNEKKASTSARYTYFASTPHFNAWWIAPETSLTELDSIEVVGSSGDLRTSKIVIETKGLSYEVFRNKDTIMVGKSGLDQAR